MAYRPFDRYSLAHAAVGMVFELSGIPPAWAIGSHVVFEAVEDQLKVYTKDIWPDASPDGWPNHVADVGAFTAGYYAARSLKHHESGRVALTMLGGVAAAIWTWSLLSGDLLRRGPGT